MAKFKDKIKARQLRKKGWSIGAIAEELGISKSSASIWCLDVVLTKRQTNRLKENSIRAGHKGRMMGAAMNHKKKLDAVESSKLKAIALVDQMTQRDLFMLGIGLYWGEGTKSERSALAVVNSDPEIILVMKKWFEIIFNVKDEDFMPRIFINEIHQPRIKKVVEYWSSLLKLPKEQFGNQVLLKIKQKKVYENYDSYYGILSLKVRKSSKLKYEVLGLIDAVKKKY
ncbi:MAG: helix-turn-helix domain-containing protein [bacterium]|nr:helix-turn-helix domain-containing protein [bacterium]